MFIVTFWQFGKKENSTKVPTTGLNDIFTSYSCLLKDDCSIQNPVLWLHGDDTQSPGVWNPSKWNYCYIADFERYYFVTDWVWVKPHWEAHLKVDVLASYKTNILASTKYVLRNAYTYHPDVIDTLYSPTALASTILTEYDFATQPTYTWSWAPANGYFVLGIAGNGSHSINGITYYCFTRTELVSVIEYMYRNVTNMQWDSMSDWNDVVSKAFIDPLDYICSAYWFPFDPYQIVGPPAYENVHFGFWTTSISGKYMTEPTLTIDWNFTNPLNPYSSGMAWENLPPFAQYFIDFDPFGTIPLNALRVYNSGGLGCRMIVDFTTGLGKLSIYDYPASTPGRSLITARSALFGVPIPLGRQRDNLVPTLGDAAVITGAATKAMTATSAATGVGAVGLLAATSVKMFGDLLSPDTTVSGTTGSLVGLNTKCTYRAIFNKPQDANVEEFGRPLCMTKLLSTLTGYTVCADGEIEYGFMYDDERKQVEKYLTSGFYIE